MHYPFEIAVAIFQHDCNTMILIRLCPVENFNTATESHVADKTGQPINACLIIFLDHVL